MNARALLTAVCLSFPLTLARCGGPTGGGRTLSAVTAPALRPEAPLVELEDVTGSRVAIAAFRGRPVILNFWASWCGPCRHELPSLAELHRKLSPRGLVVLAVSIDEDRRALDRFMRESPPPFRVLADPMKSVAGRYGVSGIPCSFILDSEGRVAERVDGDVDWTDPIVLGAIEGLLAEAAPAHTSKGS